MKFSEIDYKNDEKLRESREADMKLSDLSKVARCHKNYCAINTTNFFLILASQFLKSNEKSYFDSAEQSVNNNSPTFRKIKRVERMIEKLLKVRMTVKPT